MTDGGGGDVNVEGVVGCQERCRASGMLQEISDIRESSVKANMMDSAKAKHLVADYIRERVFNTAQVGSDYGQSLALCCLHQNSW